MEAYACSVAVWAASCKYEHTHTYKQLHDLPNHQRLSIYQTISIKFTLVVFVQNVINNIWNKRKFSPPYDKTYFNLIPLLVLEHQAETQGRVSKFRVIGNFNLIFIILFHVLGQV